MNQETLDAFLTELTALSRKYNIEIGGCGCCQSPWLAPVDCTDRVYTADLGRCDAGNLILQEKQ